MNYQEINAYAKINFILNVLGKRADGFHEVETVMQAVDLYDRVRVGWAPVWEESPSGAKACQECAGELCVEVRTDCASLSTGPDNLAYKAAVLMHDLYHKDVCERITVDIEKNIPIAAGLAGGSADAAAVMTALAKLWGLWEEKQREIAEAAAVLGADVPFCVLVQAGKTACIATGTGTQLRPTEPLDCKILLSTPEFKVLTKDVYDSFDSFDQEEVGPKFDTEEFLRCARKANVQAAATYMGNHLQAAALRLFPDIEKTLTWAKAQNSPWAVHMSGSGPTVFAVYPHGSPMESACTCHSFNKTTFFVPTLLSNE